MQTRKLTIELMILSLTVIMLSSCGSTRYFHVKSDPEGALLLKADKWTVPVPLQSPENEKMTFMSKTEYSIIVMKRGFFADTMTVNKETPADITFKLKRMENVSPELPAMAAIPRSRA